MYSIKKALKARKKTALELSKEIGVTNVTISALLNLRSISGTTLMKVLNYLEETRMEGEDKWI